MLETGKNRIVSMRRLAAALVACLLLQFVISTFLSPYGAGAHSNELGRVVGAGVADADCVRRSDGGKPADQSQNCPHCAIFCNAEADGHAYSFRRILFVKLIEIPPVLSILSFSSSEFRPTEWSLGLGATWSSRAPPIFPTEDVCRASPCG